MRRKKEKKERRNEEGRTENRREVNKPNLFITSRYIIFTVSSSGGDSVVCGGREGRGEREESLRIIIYSPFVSFSTCQRTRLYKRLIENLFLQLRPHIPYPSCVMDVVVKKNDESKPVVAPSFVSAKGWFFFFPFLLLFSLPSAASFPAFATFKPLSSSLLANPSFTEEGEGEEEEKRDYSWQGEEKEKWRVFLLEFNPFYADGDAGTSLFDWKREFSILYNGYKLKGEREGNEKAEEGEEDKGKEVRGEQAEEEWTSVLRYRIPDPKRNYRGALETPREPKVRDVV
jgi:hypothetical protein